MPKSKHRKRNVKRQNKKSSSKGDMVLIQHPFANIPTDILKNGLIKAGHTYKQDFQNLLNEATRIINSVDRLHLITAISIYGLFAGVGKAGVNSILKKPFNQSHVELIQAIALREPKENDKATPPTPEQIQRIFELFPELADAFHWQRLTEMDKERNSDEENILFLQEHLRIHTQAVRNWGFFNRVIKITKKLYEPLNVAFKGKNGLSATELIDFFNWLTRRAENKVGLQWNKLRKVFSTTSVESAIEVYLKLNPNIEDSFDDFKSFADIENISLDNFKSLCLIHSEYLLSYDLTFTTKEISKELGYSVDALKNSLEKLSIKFGDLATSNPEHFLLNNPTWIRPLIRLGSDEYFCSTPQVFFSFIFPIFDYLLDNDQRIERIYAKRRSEFLESETERLFKTAFPSCQTAVNYKWKDRAIEYENDLLVKIDSHLIIVEAKSGSISWKALRGTPERVKKHVEELLFEPSIQSHRLSEQILTVRNNPENSNYLLQNFPFQINEIKTVLRLSVTLEDFATLQSNLHMAKSAGWIPKDHPLAACILLADLEIIFDILETTPQKIHYLKRRSELEANMNYIGDELDLLGFYLLTGFNIGNAEYDGHHFALTGFSKKIDNYYMSQDEGVSIAKPHCKLTQWWSDICRRLEQRSFHQWSDIANILLQFSFDEQQQVEKKFNQIKKSVKKNWRVEGHICSIVVTPNKWRSDAIAVYAYKDGQKSERHDRMANVASHAFNDTHVQRCLVIAVNIDKDQYPYSTLGVYFR